MNGYAWSRGRFYPVLTGDDRYPKKLPRRFVEAYRAAKKRNENRLIELKRSQEWRDDAHAFKKKHGIRQSGLSPTERDTYIVRIASGEHLPQLLQDIDNFIEKHELDDVPYEDVVNYLLLNSRYHDTSWLGFVGYYHEGHIGTFFGEKIPYDIKRLLYKWLENGVPENIPCHLEVEYDWLFEKVWRLSCDVNH